MFVHASKAIRDVELLPAVKKNLPVLFLASVTINFLSLGLPLLTLQVYDRILPNQGSGTLPVLVAGLCAVVLLEIVMRLSRTYLVNWTGAAFEFEAMNKATQAILNADLSAVSTTGAGENLNRLSAISRLRDFYNGYTFITMIDMAFAAIFMGLIAFIGGWLVLIPLSIMCIFLGVSFYYGRRLKAGLQARDHADDRRYNFMIGTLHAQGTGRA